jgi:hypothetical protein
LSRDPIEYAVLREVRAASDLIAELNSDDAELNHDMVEGETEFFEILATALDEIDQCEIIAEGCKAKAEEIGKRRTRAEARAARIRALIEQAMVSIELSTARLPTATLTVKASGPKPIVSDESLIPSEFWEPQPPKLNRTALNKAVKLGPVPGVDMSNGSVSLQIRRS